MRELNRVLMNKGYIKTSCPCCPHGYSTLSLKIV